jgi:hypothetical protein
MDPPCNSRGDLIEVMSQRYCWIQDVEEARDARTNENAGKYLVCKVVNNKFDCEKWDE